jgi:O-antigen/teichoic acid export membrane protein
MRATPSSIIRSVLAHQGLRRYLISMSWLLCEQMLRMGLALLTGVWVARYLGPSDFGTLSYVTAYVAIFTSVSKLGIDTIVVRELVHQPAREHAILGTAFWLRSVGAVIAILVLCTTALLTSAERRTAIYIVIIGLGMAFQGFEVIDYFFQSRVRSKFVSICRIVQLSISTSLKVYLVLSGAELLWFVVVTFVDQAVLGMTLVIAYNWQKAGSFYRQFDRSLALNMLRDGWPLAFSALMIIVYMRVDQIMLKTMLGDAEVGIYSAAVKLTEVWYAIAMILTNSLAPAVMSAKTADQTAYLGRVQNLYGLMLWFGLIIALPTSLLSQQIIDLLYGPAFQSAGTVLAVMIWAVVFVNLLVSTGQFLIAENRTRFAFFRNVLGMTVNITLNLLLIPKLGALGAAIASVSGYVTSACLANLCVPSMRQTFAMELKAWLFPVTLLRALRDNRGLRL